MQYTERSRGKRPVYGVAGSSVLAGKNAEENEDDTMVDSMEPADIKWFGQGTVKKSEKHDDLKADNLHAAGAEDEHTNITEAEERKTSLENRKDRLRGVVQRESWEGQDAKWVSKEIVRLA